MVSIVHSNRNHCLFHVFCKQTGTKPTILFFHTEMRWLNYYSCFWTAGRSHLLCNHRNTSVWNFQNRNLSFNLVYLRDVPILHIKWSKYVFARNWDECGKKQRNVILAFIQKFQVWIVCQNKKFNSVLRYSCFRYGHPNWSDKEFVSDEWISLPRIFFHCRSWRDMVRDNAVIPFNLDFINDELLRMSSLNC